VADVPPKRPTGRPPLDPTDESVRLSFRLTTKQYDEVYRQAAARRLTVAEYLRAVVKHAAQIRRP